LVVADISVGVLDGTGTLAAEGTCEKGIPGAFIVDGLEPGKDAVEVEFVAAWQEC